MPIKLDKAKLKSGDILCTQEGSGIVSFGQGFVMSLRAIANAASSASYKWNHMAIYHEFTTGTGTKVGTIVHAVGSGVKNDELWKEAGNYRVYRCRKPKIGQKAGDVASRWADCGMNAHQYNTRKAVGSVFTTSTFGPEATRRAEEYHAAADIRGLPPGMNASRENEKSFFCSMFVAAVYQAVEGPPLCKDYMGMDSRGSSPMALVGYLKENKTYWDMVIDYK
jgi:hypothetical protein